MSVAAHVGKVSKDYSPYGYSIMEESTIAVVSSGGGNRRALLLIADDADVFIESVYFANGRSNLAATTLPNDLVMRLATAPLSATTTPTLTAITSDVTTLVAWESRVSRAATVTTPVVASGQGVWLEVLANGSFSATAAIGCVVRYRRKA